MLHKIGSVSSLSASRPLALDLLCSSVSTSSLSHSTTMRFAAVAAAVFGFASFAVAAPLEKRGDGTATWYTQGGNAGSASLPSPTVTDLGRLRVGVQ